MKSDRSLRLMLASVAIVGLLLAGAAVPLAGAYTALGIAMGASLATANLWAIGLLVRRLLGDEAPALPWALLAVAKLGLLLGVVSVLAFWGLADILAIVFGYGALPVGVVVAQLGARRSADEQA